MENQLMRVALIGASVPLALALWWSVGGAGSAADGERLAASSPLGVRSASGGDPNHNLRQLLLLQKDLDIIQERYVERERLDPEAMFMGALEEVEREVAEVMFVRTPGGDKLHVSVGAYSTVRPIPPLTDLRELFPALSEVAGILDEHLSAEVVRADVEYALINGVLSTLDPHSLLLPPVAARDMDVDNQGEFGGLGIEISSKDGRLIVRNPQPDSPAARAGLKTNDQIVRIEGVSTINMDMDEAVSRLRGEVGSEVHLEVRRAGKDKPIPFSIVRAAIRVNPVEGELLEGNVGYIQIKTFHDKVADDLDAMLSRFGRESGNQLRGLILDLRSNPGGYLNQAIKVVDRFVESGVIVTTVESGDRRRDPNPARDDGNEPDYPIIVLVNASSASASEIVAGALRNQHRAVIMGERSFGKGSVQHLFNHKDGSRLKLTVSQYLTPGDQSIQSIGIPPDILLAPSVVRPADPKDGGEPLVSLYWREWVDREVNLSGHLEHASTSLRGDTAYTLRYLRPPSEESDSDRPDPNRDWEVQLAREVVLASPSASRVDMLLAAGPIIERHAARENTAIQTAFSALGIDWSQGIPVASPSLEVRLDLGPDNKLHAGVEDALTVAVTNTGSEPLYRLSAYTTADNPSLDRREFYFGRLNPGETRRYTQRLTLPVGYGEEVSPLTLTFRDAATDSLLVTSEPLRVAGQPLPQLTYAVTLLDDGSGRSRGDGDHLPEVGEKIELELTITNRGAGPTRGGFARLKNRSGRELDLHDGVLSVGYPRLPDGSDCDMETDRGCAYTLAPSSPASRSPTASPSRCCPPRAARRRSAGRSSCSSAMTTPTTTPRSRGAGSTTTSACPRAWC